jgi:hypothetical protein
MARNRRSSRGNGAGNGNPQPAARAGNQPKAANGAKNGNQPRNGGGNGGKNGKGRGAGGGQAATAAAKAASVRDFWGTHLPVPEPVASVRPADNPSAVVRSLGSPPLTGHETIAEHYFAAVYEKAAKSASALAAASGLLDYDQGA